MPRTAIAVPRTTAAQRQLVRNFGTCLNFLLSTDTPVSASVWSTTVTNFSMGAWFKSSNYKSNRQPIITNGSSAGGNHGYAIELSGNATTDGSIMLLNHNVAWIDCGFKVQDNNWHFILLTVDGSNNAVVYLDGVSRYTGTPTIGIPSSNSGLGCDGVGIFKGLIDEGRFYNTKLTAGEALNLYYGIEPTATPLNWYKCDEGSGTTAIDSGSSAKNLTGANTYPAYSTNVFIIPRTTAGARTLSGGP